MPSPAQSPGDGRIRVALVDDSSIFLRGLTSILELENDFQVVATATSASDGFAAILERQPQVAIVDLRLRRCASDTDSRLETGVELLHQIRGATSAPTLVLSSYHRCLPGVRKAPFIILKKCLNNVSCSKEDTTLR